MIVPKHIRQVLATRYEYVIAEKEVVADLVDDLRLCSKCGDWCPTWVDMMDSFPMADAHSTPDQNPYSVQAAVVTSIWHVSHHRFWLSRPEGTDGPVRLVRKSAQIRSILVSEKSLPPKIRIAVLFRRSDRNIVKSVIQISSILRMIMITTIKCGRSAILGELFWPGLEIFMLTVTF